MKSKNYLSLAQLGIINILKNGGLIEYWNDDPPEVEICDNDGKNRKRIDIRTFNVLKSKNIIIKYDVNYKYLDERWILNKNGLKKMMIIK